MSLDISVYMPQVYQWANTIIQLLMPIAVISLGFGLGLFIIRKVTALFGSLH